MIIINVIILLYKLYKLLYNNDLWILFQIIVYI